MGFFRDKKVLIVGGTGTIGHSLLKFILNDGPRVIRVFSRDEHKQFELQQCYYHYDNIRYLIGDVRDAERLKRAMQDIDYVYHCAAMKHVPACEYNPFEAVQTNVIGTQNVILASLENKVKKTVFISTDKAIAPTNTYGASKLMAERLISAAQFQAGPSLTKFAAVRFGNVMGSRGSVIPLFVKQIVENRKINITSLDMVRYMMTLDQATELTLKAMRYAQGGEVFVLKMPIVKLVDLANAVIKLTSQKIGIDPKTVVINEIGIRPGEKLFEELMTEEEYLRALELDDMYIIPNEFIKKGTYTGLISNDKPICKVEKENPIHFMEVEKLLKQANIMWS
ncbi:SDR family NAD(P)-dependent oxidoreductase [Paenibacillus sp. PAMC21692]|uniref:SDR family NAD(P)-dependent oxidoreductase n=1 Tax=Paenibacillus sp. PAMC21692 TaxID=2762320 RepID=UPI00164D87EC|nr:SDR family NAD(P)-dependent oxidoreductase [Paenibacillus sp. PAMC21692]QNK58366.1 polysaccharide biosynthesis protein [Paenibacillus sp. PAMC21692]